MRKSRPLPMVTVPNVGDTLVLDCGYRAHTDDQPCRILSLSEVGGLFGGIETVATVREPGGEVFSTTLLRRAD